MSFEDAINAMSGNKKTDKERAEEILKNPNEAVRFYESLNDKMNKTKGLSKWFEAVDTIGDMVVDYAKGNYREVPLNTIIGATAALIYFLSPIDVLPDVVAGLGQLDDIAIIAFAVKSISHDLDKYREWKRLPDISIEKRFATCSGKTTKESATIDAEYDGAFVTDEVVQKAMEFATEATPTRLLTHHAKSDSVKL